MFSGDCYELKTLKLHYSIFFVLTKDPITVWMRCQRDHLQWQPHRVITSSLLCFMETFSLFTVLVFISHRFTSINSVSSHMRNWRSVWLPFDAVYRIKVKDEPVKGVEHLNSLCDISSWKLVENRFSTSAWHLSHGQKHDSSKWT